MLPMTPATTTVKLTSDSTATLDVLIGYAELTIATGLFATADTQLTKVSSTTPATVLAARSSASVVRTPRSVQIVNTHATLTATVILDFNANGTAYRWHKVTLRAGEEVTWSIEQGWFTHAPNTDSLYLTRGESSFGQNILASRLSRVAVGTFVTVSGTAYYVYVGRTARETTALWSELHVTTAGAGAQTAEMGLFSTPLPPSATAQTLTKIVATGTVDSLTTTGMKRNTSSYAQLVPANTHLWAAYRGAMATTQITAAGLAGDSSQGHVLTTTGGGALTALSTASGVIPTLATATQAPNISVRFV